MFIGVQDGRFVATISNNHAADSSTHSSKHTRTRMMDDVFQFFAARSFNRDIGQWDVSKVTNMRQMVRKKKKAGEDATLVCCACL
jgi:surface protein